MPSQGPGQFATTRWSVVLAAGRRSSPASQAALADLCQRYWYPLHVYVRRSVADVHEARDLTQEFFARLLEKNAVARADPQRGRFRTFLITALKNFLCNEWDKAAARKRGGGRTVLALDFDAMDGRRPVEPADAWTPERLYDRQWALTLLDHVLDRLRAEYALAGKTGLFEELKASITGSAGSASYAEAGRRLGMTEAAVKVAAHRLRKRYRALLRAEVAQTLASEEDVDQEIRGLFEALGNE